MRSTCPALLLLTVACATHQEPGTQVDAQVISFDASPQVFDAPPQCDPSGGNTCNGSNVVTCNPDGTFGSAVQACGVGETCMAGSCSDTCTADGVDFVYVVDAEDTVTVIEIHKR